MKEIIVDIIKSLWGDFSSWISSPLKTGVMSMAEFIFGSLNRSMFSALDNPILTSISYFAFFCCCISMVASLPFYLLKIVTEEKRDWRVIAQCFLNSFLFVIGNQLFAKLCFVFPLMITSGLDFLIFGTSAGGVLEFVGGLFTSNLLRMFMTLFMAIAFIGFLAVAIMRIGAVYIQILIAPFYVPAAVVGDNQKLYEWMHSTIAAGVTYAVQFLTFYAGFLIIRFSTGLIDNMIGLSLLFGTFGVPKALQKFGWSSGAAHSFQSMMMPATSLVSMLMRR